MDDDQENPSCINPVSRPDYVPGPALFLMDDKLRLEIQSSISLTEFMDGEQSVLSEEEGIKRTKAIVKLRKIVQEWAKRVAFQRRLPKDYIRDASAVVVVYGSYGLGVHNCESDIDALCVGPCFATMAEDFFVVLRNMLASSPEVSDIQCVKDAKVPLMRFKLDGIPFDLPYAKLNATSIPENEDLLNPLLLANIDEVSRRTLLGVLANRRILQLVPNVEVYQALLRCIKYWAKRRGIYGNTLGFFGGIHWAVLAALICKKQPAAHLSALVSSFFHTFAFWPWPAPVILDDDVAPGNISIHASLMPIQLPAIPNEYCYSNITRSTFSRIRTEFRHGHTLTKDFLRPDFEWRVLFEPFSYAKNYSRFLKICLSAPDKDELRDWVGWVKSRILSLNSMLEDLQGFCDPNPTEYNDIDLPEPNIVFCWGLNRSRSQNIDVDSIKEAFLKRNYAGYMGPTGSIELKVVRAFELPQAETNSGTRACWKIEDKNQQRTALYSKYIPGYFVGYLVHDGNIGLSSDTD